MTSKDEDLWVIVQGEGQGEVQDEGQCEVQGEVPQPTYRWARTVIGVVGDIWSDATSTKEVNPVHYSFPVQDDTNAGWLTKSCEYAAKRVLKPTEYVLGNSTLGDTAVGIHGSVTKAL